MYFHAFNAKPAQKYYFFFEYANFLNYFRYLLFKSNTILPK